MTQESAERWGGPSPSEDRRREPLKLDGVGGEGGAPSLASYSCLAAHTWAPTVKMGCTHTATQVACDLSSCHVPQKRKEAAVCGSHRLAFPGPPRLPVLQIQGSVVTEEGQSLWTWADGNQAVNSPE